MNHHKEEHVKKTGVKQWDKGTAAACTSVLAVVLLVVVLISWNIYDYSQSQELESQRYLMELGESLCHSVDGRLETSLKELEFIAGGYAGQAGPGQSIDPRLDLLGLSQVYILDGQGQWTGDGGRPVDFSTQPWAAAALAGERVVARPDEAFAQLLEMEDCFVLAVPVRKGGVVAGAAVGFAAQDWGSDLLDATYFDGEVFFNLVESDGDFLFPNQVGTEGAAVIRDKGYAQGGNLFDTLETRAQFLQGGVEALRTAALEGQSCRVAFQYGSDGVERTGVILPLEHTGIHLWMVAVNVTGSHVSDNFRSSIVINLLVVGLFVVLAIVLLMFYRHSRKMAFEDPVTGGCSPTRFDMESERLIHQGQPGEYSLLSVNVDHFKLVNDRFGKEMGDRLLRHIYTRIRQFIRPDELVSRHSSDNFDVLLRSSCTDREMFLRIQDMTRAVERDLEKQLEMRVKNRYALSLRCGVYRITNPALPMVILRDRAILARKHPTHTMEGRMGVCGFYSDVERSRLLYEKHLENRMEAALKAEEFVVYFQPKVALGGRRHIEGAEALVRWIDPMEGLVPPNKFIPFFERNGFIRQLDLYVFQQVCACIRRWMDQGMRLVPISVNLSRIHLEDPDFLRSFVAVQKRFRIPTQLLELELTETAVADDLDAVVEAVERIHAAGFRCSLDDFGSGYSSLNNLKELDVDTLKLDKAFCRSLEMDEPKERAIIASVVAMARKLGMTTVAEGVETLRQCEFLQEVHCDMIQGYLVSKPVPVERFEEMLASQPEPKGA